MKAIIFSILSSVFICGGFCKTATAQSKDNPFGNANTKVVELKVTGMTCQGCADHVTGVLSKKDGIVKSDVKFAENSATVTYDPAKTNETEIVNTINATGYKAQLKGTTEKSKGKKPEGSADVKGDVSFYEVPLICAAAPEIGCGSKSKPVLLGLEEKNTVVSEAWLNRTGTVIAVVWQKGTSPDLRTATTNIVFEENNMNVTGLSGQNHQNMLTDFGNKTNWYKGNDVDKLSTEEADVIASRLVTRISSTTTLSKEKSEGLKKGFADVFKTCFTKNYGSEINGNDQKIWTDNKQDIEEGLLAVGKKYLTENELTSLKEAIALGLSPTESEGKNAKGCCTPKKKSS
jgi:copper chaperone CopZ